MASVTEINSEAGVLLLTFRQIVATGLAVSPYLSATAAHAAIAIHSTAATKMATRYGSTSILQPIPKAESHSASTEIVLQRKERFGPRKSVRALSTKRSSNWMAGCVRRNAVSEDNDLFIIFCV